MCPAAVGPLAANAASPGERETSREAGDFFLCVGLQLLLKCDLAQRDLTKAHQACHRWGPDQPPLSGTTPLPCPSLPQKIDRKVLFNGHGEAAQPAAVGNPFVRRTCGSFAARGE